jgi:hypothetical protein
MVVGLGGTGVNRENEGSFAFDAPVHCNSSNLNGGLPARRVEAHACLTILQSPPISAAPS